MLGNTELGTSFLKHHLLHLLNICNSFAASTVLHSGIQTVVCHICCSVHQSLISSLSIVSSGEWLVLIWLMVVPWLYYQPWPWHDCFLWVKIWNDFKANSADRTLIKFMCSLVSSAIQSLPVEQSLVAAPQLCFEASEVIVISTSPNIGLDADSVESIHHLKGPLILFPNWSSYNIYKQ